MKYRVRYIKCPDCLGNTPWCQTCGGFGKIPLSERQPEFREWVWWAIVLVVVAGCCVAFIWGKP